MRFEEWYEQLGARNFRAREFTSYFGRRRGSVRNSPPPPKLWENIVPTLRIVDDLRDHFGSPCVLLSSYRSPAYNRAVGGAPQSYHKTFQALDIAIRDATPREVYAVLKRWRARGKFLGGLGRYSTFVHVDTRGHNADW